MDFPNKQKKREKSVWHDHWKSFQYTKLNLIPYLPFMLRKFLPYLKPKVKRMRSNPINLTSITKYSLICIQDSLCNKKEHIILIYPAIFYSKLYFKSSASLQFKTTESFSIVDFRSIISDLEYFVISRGFATQPLSGN